MSDATISILIITLTFLLAGWVKGVIGMGLPTVAMGLLSLAMPPVQAAALLVIPSLATNVWQLLAGPSFAALIKRFAAMMIAIVLGTLAGISLLTGSGGAAATVTLGIVLAAYGIVGLRAVTSRSPRVMSPGSRR